MTTLDSPAATHRHVTQAALLATLTQVTEGDGDSGWASVRHLTALTRAAGYGVRTEGVLDLLNQLADDGAIERSRTPSGTFYRTVRA